MRNAFVTGATGFVGLNLVRELEARGWDVVALHRESSDLTYLEPCAAERAVGDVTDAGSLRRAMPDGVDAVFHVAASTNMWSRKNAEQTRANVDGTRNVARVALEKKARRMVHTSSVAAYGEHAEPIDEDSPQRGAQSWINYLRTKALAEVEVRRAIDSGLDAVIVNPTNIIGPFDLWSWGSMFRVVDAGRLPGAPPGRGSFCHVHEVAKAHVEAALRGGTGENYLLGGTEATYLELVRVIGELAGREVPAKATPAWLLKLSGRVAALSSRVTRKKPFLTPEAAALVCRTMMTRTDKAQRELGYRPRPLREMAEDCYRWLAAEGKVGTARNSAVRGVP